MYVDYNYYKNVFGGSLVTSSDFNKYELQARLTMDGYTLKKDMTVQLLDTHHKDAIKTAMCELIDNIKELESLHDKAVIGSQMHVAGIASETVKDHTVTSVSSKDNPLDTYNQLVKSTSIAIMRKYLLPTGLLYRGFSL